jgi:putative nucleotidyltransferase with HDIG domain
MIEDTVSRNQIIRLHNITAPGEYAYAHAINVAVLTAVIAGDMDYNALKMHELIMGALLHDIGKIFTDGETKTDHAKNGFDYVRKLRGYSSVSAHVVLEHHEKFDGTGYPRKLCGDQIHEYARITAIADAYDNMVSDHQQEILLPHQAYEAIMTMSGNYFDTEIVDLFLAKAPLYPLGTFVVLDSGDIGVITEARPKLQSRPTVMIITDANGVFYNEWEEINLAESLTVFITRVMSEEEILALTKRYENKL